MLSRSGLNVYYYKCSEISTVTTNEIAVNSVVSIGSLCALIHHDHYCIHLTLFIHCCLTAISILARSRSVASRLRRSRTLTPCECVLKCTSHNACVCCVLCWLCKNFFFRFVFTALFSRTNLNQLLSAANSASAVPVSVSRICASRHHRECM